MTNIEQMLLFLVSILLLFIVSALILGFYNLFYSHRLASYLKNNNPKRWKQLYTIKEIGSLLSNTLSSFSYISNKLDTEDRNILRYKNKLRFGSKIFFINVLLVWILIILILITALSFGGKS